MSASKEQFECIKSLFVAVSEAHGNVASISLETTLDDFIKMYAPNGIRFKYVKPLKSDRTNHKEEELRIKL